MYFEFDHFQFPLDTYSGFITCAWEYLKNKKKHVFVFKY